MRRWFHRKPRYASRQEVQQVKDLLDRLGEIVSDETGLSLASAASVQVSAGVPPGLVAASRCRHTEGEPVRLDIKGVPLIAVVGGEGDPRDWFRALATLTHPSYAARPGVPRIGHRPFPEGLLVVARKDAGTALWVATVGVDKTGHETCIPASTQQAAVRVALRAARRQGWRTPVLVPAAAFGAGLALEGARVAVKAAGQAVRAHAGAAVVSAGAVAAGTAMVVTLAGAHAPPRRAGSAPRAPAAAPSSRRTARERWGAVPSRHSPSLAPGRVSRGRSRHRPVPAGLGASPEPSGQPSPAPTRPSPHPSPGVSVKVSVSASAPPGGGHKKCLLWVLGICVKV